MANCNLKTSSPLALESRLLISYFVFAKEFWGLTCGAPWLHDSSDQPDRRVSSFPPDSVALHITSPSLLPSSSVSAIGLPPATTQPQTCVCISESRDLTDLSTPLPVQPHWGPTYHVDFPVSLLSNDYANSSWLFQGSKWGWFGGLPLLPAWRHHVHAFHRASVCISSLGVNSACFPGLMLPDQLLLQCW